MKATGPGSDCPLVLIAIEENAAILMEQLRWVKNDLMTCRQTPSPENAARRVKIKRAAENVTAAVARLLEDWID